MPLEKDLEYDMAVLKEIVTKTGWEVFCGGDLLERPVVGAYCGDLLSDVLANAAAGSIWITVQMHPNIAAVASLKELSAILLANDRKPQPETVEKAANEKIPILGSRSSAYELAVQLSKLLSAAESHAEANQS